MLDQPEGESMDYDVVIVGGDPAQAGEPRAFRGAAGKGLTTLAGPRR